MQWGMGLIALSLAGLAVFDAWSASEYAQSLLKRLEAKTVISNTMQPQVVWSRQELLRVQAVNAAIRELNVSITPVLRALQPPQDIRVAVLSIDMPGVVSADSGQASVLKITAEAFTGADMTRYVSFVADQYPITSAYLAHHEVTETLPERPYRFTMEAKWRE